MGILFCMHSNDFLLEFHLYYNGVENAFPKGASEFWSRLQKIILQKVYPLLGMDYI